MIEFHDPTGLSARAVDSYNLAFDMAATAEDKPTIGLLANGFADSERFLRLIGDAIKVRYPTVTLKSSFATGGDAPKKSPLMLIIVPGAPRSGRTL